MYCRLSISHISLFCGGRKFSLLKILLSSRYSSFIQENVAPIAHRIIKSLQDGITNVRNLATGRLGVVNRRMVFRSTPRNFHKHVSFLFVDSSSLLAIFLVFGKIFTLDYPLKWALEYIGM